MNIYDQISLNKRKTALIMVLFVIVISIVGYAFGEIYSGAGFGVPFMATAVAFSSISAISSYYFSDKVVLSISGARKVKRSQFPRLYGVLENLCIGAGLKKIPDLYIINDSAPNAFATGRDPKHSVVVVTTGLIGKLNKRKIEGVLAHELSHIRNYDIRLMTVVVILVGAITMIAHIMLRGGVRGSNNRRSSGGVVILIGLALAVLSPLIAQLIKLAISRSREYLADASAALLTRDPEGLALALEEIAADREVLEVANEATAHMYILNPLRKGRNAPWFANLFNTHPPIKERIRRLRAM